LDNTVPSSSSAANGSKNNIERTDLLYGANNVIKTELRFFSNCKEKIDSCMSYTRPQLAIEIQKIKKSFIDAKGRGIKLRYLAEITAENISFYKELMTIVDVEELRHLDGIKGNFMLSESEYLAPLVLFTKIESSQIVYSNIKEVIKHQQYVFDALWGKAISAAKKIKEIEEQAEVEFVEVITDHERASSILLDLAKSLKKEALSLMPTAKGMLRMHKLGVIDHLIKASQNGAIVKIICPLTEENSDIVGKISEQAPDIRIMNSYADAPSGILIADGSRFLQAEVKNPPAEQFSQAIGFTIYSNSKHNVNSFKSFFELLWNEHALNEELRRIDKMQKEFMNVAAHELKTPVQPILGVCEVLSYEIKDTEHLELLDILNRNAKRLKRLTEDILDVTKIESQTLQLKKETFCINGLISDIVNDYLRQLGSDTENKEVNVKLLYNESGKKNDLLAVFADRGRIAQVFDNILNNAIKFTDEGSICITIRLEGKKKKQDNSDKQEVIVISVKDTGKGIDSEIMPRLFTKFSANSFQGTGLGMYISKSIVESHGGRIWAENNTDGRGATFYFSLPLILLKAD
jgi:two-component system, OmpR family, sensor histidine kinase VicK